ncbi:hypothetical protein BQ8482_250057 [Mesorhizobium delmotii]|uniref:Uncharacterized protein n=1 Tax=Mesorhizobium delmotii TaxID=1631247 RepID=A0A2P9ALZ5_9HYPH|nr:hypothetical protein BQ8482_250057 [Mesorhizobium delmotii]
MRQSQIVVVITARRLGAFLALSEERRHASFDPYQRAHVPTPTDFRPPELRNTPRTPEKHHHGTHP